MTAHQPIPLFRPEVLAARKDRLHGEVSLAVPLSWQLIGYLLFAALATAFAFIGIATYSRVETVSGTIVVDKGTAPVVPTRAGVIAAVHVRDGQSVAAGQPLATIRAEEDLAGGATAPRRVLDALAEQDRQLGQQADLMLGAADAERSRLSATIAGFAAEIASLDRQIADQESLVRLAKTEHDQVQEIASKGFLSRRELEGREAVLLGRRQQLAQLQQSRSARQASLAEARRAILQSSASARAQAVAVQAQRTELAQQSAQFDGARGFTLKAPLAGAVTALTARPGQPAAAGQPLMILVPTGGRTRVELHVPTSAAGFLAKGQQVRLAIDSFPYQQFGTVPARITEISTSAIPKQTSQGSPLPVYLVTAELEQPFVRAFGREQPLMPGMTLTARIVTRKQSLFEWLFEPLFAVSRR